MKCERGTIVSALAAMVVAVACLASGSFVLPAGAAELEQPVVAGRKAFEGSARFPWYDAEKDSLRPLDLPITREREPFKLDLGFLRTVAWGLLAVLLTALVVALVYVLLNRRGTARRKVAIGDEISHAAAYEALPFLVDRPRGDLLAEARRYYEQGNFREAIICLFSYELVQLDRSSLIHLAKGKTNRQYLREVSRVQPLASALEQTMKLFEDVFFGRRPIDRALCEACFSRVDQFELLTASAG